MALSLVVSEIFNVEKYGDLEIPVRGQSRSLKVVPFYIDWIWFPILAFYSNFVPRMHTVFQIFNCKVKVP